MTDHSEVLVTGKDMFGVPFCERAELLDLTQDEFSFALYRPVSENLTLRVNFHPDNEVAAFWVEGLISEVKNRLDGKQTVELKVNSKCLAS